MTDTINIPRAELQAALDALQECRQKIAYLLGNIEWYESAQAIDFADISIKAISARLAVDVCAEKQPDVEKTSQRVEKTAQQEEKPEPVAWLYICSGDNERPVLSHVKQTWADEWSEYWREQPLYTAPPQREFIGLTDGEITVAWNEAPRIQLWVNAFARAIEAKLKEKNT